LVVGKELHINRILLSDSHNKIFVYTTCVEGSFTPYTGTLFKITTNDTNENGLLLTYGEDSDIHGSTSCLKIWKFVEDKMKYDELGILYTIQFQEILLLDKSTNLRNIFPVYIFYLMLVLLY
jgi:hypothetical protein